MPTRELRSRSLLGLCVLTLFVLALTTASARAAFETGTNLRVLPFGGLSRAYRVYVPASVDGATPVPLVVNLHGLTSNAGQQQAISRMDRVADANGFLNVYPEGWRNAWNAKLCCGNPEVDDVGFIRAVVAAVWTEGNVDRARVYVTGLSNGGAMSHRLACDAADLFAAAAPMAFPLADQPASGCQPSRTIPVLTVMGLTDELVRYDGGFGSAAATYGYWREMNACNGRRSRDVRDERGQSRCEYRTRCANDVEVGLCSVVAQAFPGTGFSGHILYLNPDFDLAQVAWDFMSRFRRPDTGNHDFEAGLTGPDRIVLDGVPRDARLAPLSWRVRVGKGTWGATDSGGTLLSGSWRRRGSAGTAELTTAARAELEELVAARIAVLSSSTGLQLALEPAGPLRIGVDRSGAPTSLGGRFRILRGGSGGPPIGRYQLRLRRAR